MVRQSKLTALKSQCPASRAKHLLWWDGSSVGSPLTYQVGPQWEWGRRGNWWRCYRCCQLPFPAIVFHVDSDGGFTTGGDSLCSVSATSTCSDLPSVMTIAASLAVIPKPVNHRHLFHPPSLTYGGVLRCYGNLTWSTYCLLGRLPQSAGQHGRSMSWHTSSGWYPHILLSLQASVWSADRKLHPLQWRTVRAWDILTKYQLTIFTSYKMTSLYLRNIHLNVFNLAGIQPLDWRSYMHYKKSILVCGSTPPPSGFAHSY